MPANRYGNAVYSAAELKTIQEVLSLSVFAIFSVLYLKEPISFSQVIGLRFHRSRRILCLLGQAMKQLRSRQ